MKAFLLGGGLGTRLRPFTDHTPKCLVPIDGVPLLTIWLALCARHQITDVLLNVTRHGDPVREYLRSNTSGVRITLIVEEEPRGSAGTVADGRPFVDGESSFFVLHADNVTTADLSRLAAFHERHQDPLTLGLFHAPRPEQAGIVECDASGLVTRFEEKPRLPQSSLANAGVYVARPALFDAIPARDGVVDFGHDVLPSLVGRLRATEIDGYLADVGTPDGLAVATAAWRQLRAGASA